MVLCTEIELWVDKIIVLPSKNGGGKKNTGLGTINWGYFVIGIQLGDKEVL